MSLCGPLLVLAILVPGQPPAKDLNQDFRGGRLPVAPLDRFGPNADKVIKPEPEGLRITPPANGRQTLGWGVVGDFALAGDFEVTASYELLALAPPSRGLGAGVALNLAPNKQRTKWAKVGRFLRVDGDSVYVAECWTKQHSPEDFHLKLVPTEARSGKLRLERKGTMLSFRAAEGAAEDWRELFQVDFGAEDLAIVRFVVNNNSSPTALDARLLDLKIRSGNLVVTPELDVEQTSLPAALLVGLVLTLAALVLGMWLYARRRARNTDPGVADQGPPDDVAFISLQCAECGKKLRARAATAGKEVKCPHCGHAVPVPPAAT